MSAVAPLHQPDSLRWRRLAFIVYAAAIFVATHWPKLVVGPPGLPQPDRMLHFFALSVFGLLLWWTDWFARLRTFIAVGIAWVVVDELTQSLPILQRHFSWQDLVAGGLGILSAGAVIAAMRPLEGEANTQRAALRMRVLESLFGNPLQDRIALLCWSVLVVAIGGIGLSIMLAWPHVVAALPYPIPGMVYGVGIALFLGLLLHVFMKQWQRRMSQAQRARWCPWCALSCVGAATDDEGRLACASCGRDVHQGAWLEIRTSQSPVVRRNSFRTLIMGALLLAGIFIVIYGGAAVYQMIVRSGATSPALHRIAREINSLPREFTMTIDAAILLFVVALVVGRYRRAIARAIDRQHAICIACGHDLRGTPVQNGVGTCGECGAVFARFSGRGARPHE